MAQREATIRRFAASDEKLVRFAIGKASMEPLAVANRRAYFHPLTLAIWLLLSYAFINYFGHWPKAIHGYAGYLQPIPMLAACTLPVMFLIDWFNRPDFEQSSQTVLRGPDMIDILAHYSNHPASGLYILEFGDLFVGLIALDATPASGPKKSKSKGSSTSAIIRHFYVDEAYRSSGVQEDLLIYALRMAFNAEPALKIVHASDSALLPYIRNCLRDAHFALQENTQKVGVFGWQLEKRILTREDWEKKNQ